VTSRKLLKNRSGNDNDDVICRNINMNVVSFYSVYKLKKTLEAERCKLVLSRGEL